MDLSSLDSDEDGFTGAPATDLWAVDTAQWKHAYSAAQVLSRCPEGGWPETQQARRRLKEQIATCNENSEWRYWPPQGAPVTSYYEAENAWLNRVWQEDES